MSEFGTFPDEGFRDTRTLDRRSGAVMGDFQKHQLLAATAQTLELGEETRGGV